MSNTSIVQTKHSTMKNDLYNIIECCNNTHQGAPCTGKQMIRTRIVHCWTAVLESTVPYCIHSACNTSPKLALRTSVMAVMFLVSDSVPFMQDAYCENITKVCCSLYHL